MQKKPMTMWQTIKYYSNQTNFNSFNNPPSNDNMAAYNDSASYNESTAHEMVQNSVNDSRENHDRWNSNINSISSNKQVELENDKDDIKFDLNQLREGVIMSEILARPVAKRKRRRL